LDKEETFKTIVASVNLVGKKTLLQCKAKLKNLKDKYKQAKDANRRSGESFHACQYFLIFDEILGTRDSMRIPQLTQVGQKKKCTPETAGEYNGRAN